MLRIDTRRIVLLAVCSRDARSSSRNNGRDLLDVEVLVVPGGLGGLLETGVAGGRVGLLRPLNLVVASQGNSSFPAGGMTDNEIKIQE